MTPAIRELVNRAAAALKADGATEVYLFGSHAAGTARPESDVDLAVRGLPPARFFAAMSRAANAAGREIDLIDLDEETPFVKHLCKSPGLLRVA